MSSLEVIRAKRLSWFLNEVPKPSSVAVVKDTNTVVLIPNKLMFLKLCKMATRVKARSYVEEFVECNPVPPERGSAESIARSQADIAVVHEPKQWKRIRNHFVFKDGAT